MNFSLIEKKALAGMAGIALFVGYSIWEIGRRNFWWELKNTYYTHVEDADGLRVGSVVTVAGLRVGEVTGLDVDSDNRIRVTMAVKKDVAPKIREDSEAAVIRTFIIGEKRIDLVPGSQSVAALRDGAVLRGKISTDLAEFMTGRKLAELMGQVEALIGGLNGLVKGMDQVMGRYQAGQFDKAIEMVEPALVNFLKLTDDMLVMTKELKRQSKALPVFVESGAAVFSGAREDLFKDRLFRDTMAGVKDVMAPLGTVIAPFAERQALLRQVLDNVADISSELKKEPKLAGKMVTAMDELIVTLRALQKTWLLEDHSKAARREGQKTLAE